MDFNQEDLESRRATIQDSRFPYVSVPCYRLEQATSICSNTCKLDPSKFSHLFFPGRDVFGIELIKVIVAAGSRHDFHQLGGRIEETRQLFRRLLNVGGETADLPSSSWRTLAILPFTLLPGR